MIDAALAYAGRGWYVLPCEPGGKAPLARLVPHGWRDATTDAATMAAWWAETPDANIGLALSPSGLVAVDVDSYKRDCDWDAFRAGREFPADTPVQRTARGGLHYLFASDGQYPGKLCAGVDIKHNGYILLAPSVVEGSVYRLERTGALRHPPDWIPRLEPPLELRRASGPVLIPDGKLTVNGVTIDMPPVLGDQRSEVLELLRSAPNTVESRDDWVRVAIACKGVADDEEGREAWLAWCARAPQKDGEPERVWDTARPRGDVQVGTIMRLLKPWAPAPARPVPTGHDPFASSYTMRDLRNATFAPLKWIVDGFIPEGLTVFAGMPKAGKSFFSLQLSIAISKGDLFLGARCVQRSVLLLSLEDGPRRLQERTDEMLDPDDPGPDNLYVRNTWPRLNEGGLADLEAWCDRHPDLVVIIDTRAKVDPEKKVNGKNAYEQDYAALSPLQELAQRRRISIIAITHLKKASVDGDLIKQVTGSMGVTGTADSILILGHATSDAIGAPRTLYIRGRDVEENQYLVKRDGVHWKLAEGSPKIEQTKLGAVRLAVLEALRVGPLPLAELAACIHGPTKNNLKVTLHRMVTQGQVVRTERGGYALPRV